jgi:hypothetical protein
MRFLHMIQSSCSSPSSSMEIILRLLLRKFASGGVGRTKSLNVWARGPKKGDVGDPTSSDEDIVVSECLNLLVIVRREEVMSKITKADRFEPETEVR